MKSHRRNDIPPRRVFAIDGALIVPMTMARAFSPLGAAALWSATGNYDASMSGIVMLAVVMVLAFCAAAAASMARPGKQRFH